MVALLEFTGNLGLFAGRAARRAFVPSIEKKPELVGLL
jgi:hypothetical protein